MNTQNRIASTSVTELVKQIAREVVYEELNRREKELESARYDTPNSGTSWDANEDNQLAREVSCAISQIAASHGRNFNAILSRIKQKGLV